MSLVVCHPQLGSVVGCSAPFLHVFPTGSQLGNSTKPQWAGLLTSDNTKKIRCQGLISEVILDSVKLTTLTTMGCMWRTSA